MPPFNPRSQAARREYYGLPPLGGGGPGGRPKGMSVDQWAKMRAREIINAQVKAIQQAKQMYQDEINADADEQRGKYDQLARGLQAMNFPGQIQSIFGGAAGSIEGMAGAMGAGQAAQTDAQAGALQNMVSGTGQEGSMASMGGILGDVTGGMYGEIPGQAFGDSGKAFAAQAALEPGLALQIGYGDVETSRREQMKGLKDFMLQIAEARSGQPGLRMELASARREELAGERDAEREWRLKLAAMYLSQGKFKLAQQQMDLANRRHKLNVRKQTVAEKKAQGLGPTGKPLPQDPKKAPDIPAIRQDISQDAAEMFDVVQTPGANPWDDPVESTKPWAYEKAFKTLWARYKGSMPGKKLRRVINEVLIAAGIVPPPRVPRGAGGNTPWPGPR